MCNPRFEVCPPHQASTILKGMNIRKMRDYFANLRGPKTAKKPAKSTIASAKSHVLKILSLHALVSIT